MKRQNYPKNSAKPEKSGLVTSRLAISFVGAIITCMVTAQPATAQNYDPDAAAARCRQFTNSVRNLRELSDRRDVLMAVRICIGLGIDPPLKARRDYGRSPASGVAAAQIPGRTCPPFATCLYSARVNEASTAPVTYNAVGGSRRGGGNGGSGGGTGSGSTINSLPVNSAFNAPNFTGHLPNQIPEHLVNGGTIYFYGNTSITPPANSLLYPDGATNQYADGGAEGISNGHVMTPPAPNGNIMAQQPVITNRQVLFNFDDGGVMVMPPGFVGVINGQEVRGGDTVLVNHADDILIPSGTQLYPFPMGSHPAGEHAGEHNHAPYTGPPVTVPPSDVRVDNNGLPGVGVWWTAP